METFSIYLLLLLFGAVVGGTIIMAIVKSLAAVFSTRMPMRYPGAVLDPVPHRSGIGPALLFVLVGGAFLFFWSQGQKGPQQQEKTQMQLLPSPETPLTTPVDTLPEEVPEMVESSIQQTDTAIKTLPNYYIQVSAFKDWQNAKAQLEKLIQQTVHNAYMGVLETDPTPYKVLIGPFESTAHATAFAKRHTIRGFVRTDEALELVTYR